MNVDQGERAPDAGPMEVDGERQDNASGGAVGVDATAARAASTDVAIPGASPDLDLLEANWNTSNEAVQLGVSLLQELTARSKLAAQLYNDKKASGKP